MWKMSVDFYGEHNVAMCKQWHCGNETIAKEN